MPTHRPLTAILLEKKTDQHEKSRLFRVTTAPVLAQEPVLVVLPARDVINHIHPGRNAELSGTAKFAPAPGYRVLGLAYSSTTALEHHVDLYQQSGPFSGWSPDIDDVMQTIIAPNVADLAPLSSSARYQALIDCFYGFRNLKLFSFSYGGIAQSDFNNALNFLLIDRGFTATERAFLIPQIMHFGVAGVGNSLTEAQKNLLATTSVMVRALNDRRIADYFKGFSTIEQQIDQQLTDAQKLAGFRYHDNQLCFYTHHHPEKTRQMPDAPPRPDLARFHSLVTHLTPKASLTGQDDPFPIIHRAIWSAMIGHHAAAIPLPPETSPASRWQWLQDHFAHPLNAVLDTAKEQADCAALFDNLVMADVTLPPRADIAPIFATNAQIPLDHTKLADEISRRIDPDLADWLLRANIDDVRDALANPATATKISHAWQILWGHDIPIPDPEIWQNNIIPLQRAWLNNTQHEDMMSILHTIKNR